MAGLTMQNETFDTSGFEALQYTEIDQGVVGEVAWLESDTISYRRCGELTLCLGKCFTYERVGDFKKFKQHGKIESLRRLKVKIKKLENL